MSLQIAPIAIAPRTWTVDVEASQIRFKIRNMWGLATVKGTFDRFEGGLTVEAGTIHATFSVDAASLNTENKRRDGHLRSAEFFDVEQHPRIGFEVSSVAPSESGLTITGDLLIRDSRLHVSLPVDVYDNADRLLLRTTTAVSREAAGLGRNRMGTIRGDAAVHIELTLVQETGYRRRGRGNG
jgi:polyisoprenoid-binding protein YceI